MEKDKMTPTPPAVLKRRRKAAPPKKAVKAGTIVYYSLLVLIIAAFFVGMRFVMNSLNDWLLRFEASQPNAKCEEVFNRLFADPDWSEIYTLAEPEGEISAGDYAAYMEQKIGDGKLSYIETSAGLSGDKKYIVRNGTEKVATFTLHNAQPQADIPDWQLDTVEIFCTAELSVTLQAPPDYTVTVNGTVLDDSHVIRSVTTKAEDYLPDGVHGYRMNELLVTGLLTEPEITVTDAAGEPVEVHYDAEYRTYDCRIPAKELTDSQENTLTSAAETYCRYMIGATTATELKKYFDSASEIYRTVTTNTTWMQNYAGYELGQAEIADACVYSDGSFSARVSLTVNVTRKGGTVKEYQLDNTFFLRETDGSDRVWEMINANAQDTCTTVRLTYVSEGAVLKTEMVDAESTTLTPPEVTVPDGKEFAGWFTESVDSEGVKTMELAFLPKEDGSVRLPADSILEPMTLYALYQ